LQQYFVNGIAAGQTSYPFNVDGDMKGAELDLQALLTERDRIGFNVLRVEGKFDRTPLLVASTGVTQALTNQPRYNLPEWTINATYNHMFDLGRGDVDFGVRAHYESESFLRLIDRAGLTPGDLKEAYVKWDLDLTFRPKEGDWTVGAFVKNVTNEAVVGVGSNGQTSVGSWFKPVTNPGAKFASLEAPRTYGVRVTASFGK
jgi:iron complex outermembrane recepter protein